MTAYDTVDAAMDVVGELRDRFAARDAKYHELNELVFQEREIKVPKAYQYYTLTAHSPLAFYALQVLTSTICADGKTIQLAPFQQGEAGDTNATRREHWHESCWDTIEDAAQRPLYYPFVMALVHKGEGIMKDMLRSQRAWGDYYQHSRKLQQELKADTSKTYTQRSAAWKQGTEQYKQSAPFPIVSTDVVPESFWYLLGEDGMTCAVEALEIPYSRAFALFKDGASADGRAITPAALGLGYPPNTSHAGIPDIVKVYALWDCEHVTYCVEGAGASAGDVYLAKSQAHAYGNPFTKTLDGPFHRAEGIVTGHRAPEKRAWGALTAFMSLFPLLSAGLTASGQLGFYTAWPVLKQTAADLGVNPDEVWGPNTGVKKPEYEPGRVLPLGVDFAQPPRSGPELQQFMDTLFTFMDLLVPQVLRGGGGTSGYDTNQRIHLGMINLDMFVKNLERTLSRREAWIDQLITLVGEKVYVEHAAKGPMQSRARAEYLGLGPDDVDHGRHYQVRVKPSTPSNDALDVKRIMDELGVGLMNRRQAIEERGRNYDEVELGRQIDGIMASDPVQQYINAEVLRRLGLSQQAVLDQANAQFAGLVQQGYPNQMGQGPVQPPGNMPPGQGGVFAPGVGMPAQPTPAGVVNGPMPGGGVSHPVGGPAGVPRVPANAYPIPGGM